MAELFLATVFGCFGLGAVGISVIGFAYTSETDEALLTSIVSGVLGMIFLGLTYILLSGGA